MSMIGSQLCTATFSGYRCRLKLKHVGVHRAEDFGSITVTWTNKVKRISSNRIHVEYQCIECATVFESDLPESFCAVCRR